MKIENREQILGFPGVMQKFLKQNADNIKENQKRFVTYFMDNPCFYSCFDIREKLEKNLFIIYDWTFYEERILYSPGTDEHYKTGSTLFFTLLFNNGFCYQAAGPIWAFKCVRPDDIEYMSMELNPGLYQKSGSGAVILQNAASADYLKAYNKGEPLPSAETLSQKYHIPREQEDRPSIEFEHAVELLEFLHEEAFEQPNQMPLLYILYLFHEAGTIFRPVREYTAEYIKAFWQVHFDKKEDLDLARFETFLSVYIFNVLGTVGLIDTDPEDLTAPDVEKGTYRVKASDFFNAWLKWT